LNISSKIKNIIFFTVHLLSINNLYSASKKPTLNPSAKTDIILFSKDRAMQLWCFLESVEKHVSNAHTIHILYKTSDEEHQSSYEECFQYFRKKSLKIKSYKESKLNKFKPLLLSIINKINSSHILFAVDDLIIFENIDLEKCSKYLDRHKAYGFYFRLGKNTTYCYSLKQIVRVPRFQTIKKNLNKFQFFQKNGGDWAYPCSLDSLFSIKTIKKEINSSLSFHNPNSLEQSWHMKHFINSKNPKCGLFLNKSQLVSIPLNITQNQAPQNSHMSLSSFSKENLLTLFKKGYRINFYNLKKITINAPHAELNPTFYKLEINK